MSKRVRRIALIVVGAAVTSGLSVAATSSAFAGFSFGH
jgi:hypothetical protein